MYPAPPVTIQVMGAAYGLADAPPDIGTHLQLLARESLVRLEVLGARCINNFVG